MLSAIAENGSAPPSRIGDPTFEKFHTRAVAVAMAFFVLSGAAALVYQVAWQRLLALTTGVAVHSVAIITAAFMAGLGIGSHLGGTLSARLTPRGSLRAFAVVEAAVAAFAMLSVPLYYFVLYQHAEWLYDGLLRGTIAHFVSLLLPTALMGMSLPLLVRGLVWERARASRTIGLLYAANALGAAAGAALTPWVLLRFLGVPGAVMVGACASSVAAAGGLAIAQRLPAGEIPPPSGDRGGAAWTGVEPAQPFASWLLLYALSGFVSLSLEMVWFRFLDVAAKGAAFTFGTLLAVYLAGFAAGTLVASRRAPVMQRPLAVFLLCQVGMVLVTLGAHALLVWLPADWPLLSALVEYGHRTYGPQMHPFRWVEFLAIYAALPVFLFGPSTFLMGFGFPVLQRATQGDPTLSGHRVGLLQAANIAGCTVGSLLTGLELFDLVGTAGVFRGLALVAAGVAGFGLWRLRERRFAVLAVLLVAGAAAFPSNARLWRRLHGDPPPADSFVEEDAATVTALTPRSEQAGFSYQMEINGRGESWLPYGWLHTVIGAVPAVAHARPEEVAVIGLGSGDTAWAASCRPETRRTVVFEIASNQMRLLRRVADYPRMARLREFLTDPRISVVKDDGRRRLRVDGRRYDLIVTDSIDPDLSMSVYIYSFEHYRLLRNRLKPGGMICVLARTPRIRAAIQRVFPHTVALGPDLRLASLDPIPIDKEVWLARLDDPQVIDYLGKSRTRLVAGFIEQAKVPPPLPEWAEVNHDLVPLDEFARPYPVPPTW
jgi:spermidine synthase